MATKLGSWAATAEALAETLNRRLDDPKWASRYRDRVLGLAREQGCTAIVGASEPGRRVVAQVGDAGQLDGTGNDRVLLVEGLLTTGANVMSALNGLRMAAATDVVVVVLLARQDALDAVAREISAPLFAIDVAS